MTNETIAKETPVMYHAKDLKAILGVGMTKCYDLMKSDAFPSIRIGGTYVVEAEAFGKWLKRYEGREYII